MSVNRATRQASETPTRPRLHGPPLLHPLTRGSRVPSPACTRQRHPDHPARGRSETRAAGEVRCARLAVNGTHLTHFVDPSWTQPQRHAHSSLPHPAHPANRGGAPHLEAGVLDMPCSVRIAQVRILLWLFPFALLPLRTTPFPSARPPHHHDMSAKRATRQASETPTRPSPSRSTTPPSTHARFSGPKPRLHATTPPRPPSPWAV